MGKRKLYYAVTNGRKIGVYTSFGLVQKQVMGFRGGTQRGYPTLDEALKDMQINGHNNPPIYDHNEQNIAEQRQTENVITSVSDSALSVDIYYDANLPDENLRILLLEIEHPETDLDVTQLFIRTSQSEHDLATTIQSFDSKDETMNESDTVSFNIDQQLHEMNNFEIVSDQDQTYVKDICSQTSVKHSYNEAQTSSMSTQTDKNNIENNENLLQSLIDMISSLNEKIDTLQNKLDNQTKFNQELVEALNTRHNKEESVQNVNEKRLQHLEDLVSNLDPKACTITVQEIDTKCERLCEKQKDILEAIHTQQSGHDKELNDLRSMCKYSQQLSDEVNDKVTETLKEIRQQVNLESNVNKENNLNATIQKPSSPQPQHDIKSTPDSNISNSVVNNKEDSKSEDEDIEVFTQHHVRMISQQHPIENPRPKFYLSNEKCKNVLLGDSNMKTINRARLDKTKQTEIRTYRGATIQSLTKIIDTSDTVYGQVEKVSVCIGSVDCGRRYIDEKKILSDYDNLLVTIRKVFPAADITITSIPPQQNRFTNQYIWKINLSLKSLSKEKNVTYSSCSSLWMHVSKAGEVDDGLLVDNIHLSPRGIGLLLRPIINFFYGQRRQETHLPTGDSNSQETPTKENDDSSSQSSYQESSNIKNDLKSSEKTSKTTNDNHAQGPTTSQADYAQQMKTFSDSLAQLLSSGIMTFTNHMQSLSSKS